jgi:hypothetical protein
MYGVRVTPPGIAEKFAERGKPLNSHIRHAATFLFCLALVIRPARLPASNLGSRSCFGGVG